MKTKISEGKTYLGIEFGSTRIKAVLTDDTYTPVASGAHDWENQFENGYWTYSEQAILDGLRDCFSSLADDVKRKYGVSLKTVGAIGISGMMHGYLPFDRDYRLLAPFRTWRNTTTEQAADALTETFGFNIPQRWSCAHLYQAMLNREPHVPSIAYVNTLAGYVHYRLTGRHEVGVGEASGILPIENGDYNPKMIKELQRLTAEAGYDLNIRALLPTVRRAGESGAYLTEAGAALLDETGTLCAGIPLCPPEGDAGTGMVATNAVRPATGNISAGTSVFSMLVLERPLGGIYREIDVVTTPDGAPVAMVHSNNGCSEIDACVGMLDEFTELIGTKVEKSRLYDLFYHTAMKGEPDCGGNISYNFLAGEPVAGVRAGHPMYYRESGRKLTLASLFRSQIYAAIAPVKLGMDDLAKNEAVRTERFSAHGGLFKTAGVAQGMLADALKVPITVQTTAGEGGAWGMALLAAYMMCKEDLSLDVWLEEKVFSKTEKSTLSPNAEGVDGFDRYMSGYRKGLAAQRSMDGEE